MQAAVADVMQKLMSCFAEIDKPTLYISHLSQKAQSLIKKEDISVTAVQYQHNKSVGIGPIVDIGVTFNKKRIPVGWELLEKSVSGKLLANVNKGNGKEVYLCFKRAEKGSKQRPITGLGVIFRNLSEEPSLGFRCIDKTVGGENANVNVNPAQGHVVYLCTHRGNGAPIQDISVVFPEKKETLPVGYHLVKHTPFGKQADLNSMTSGQAVYLCFRPDCQLVLDKFEPFCKSPDPDTRQAALCLSILAECFYTYDTRVVCFALEAFRKVPPTWAADLINLFVVTLCDASFCFHAYFTSELYVFYLKSQEAIFRKFLHCLTVPTLLRIFETCLLLRHEDKKLDALCKMIDFMLESSFRSVPCKCRNKQHKKWPPAVGPPCLACVQAQKNAEATTVQFCSSIVQELVNNVRISGRIEVDVSQFNRVRSRQFADVESESDRFHFSDFAQLLLSYDTMAASATITMPQAAVVNTDEEEVKEEASPPPPPPLQLVEAAIDEKFEEQDERDVVIEEIDDGASTLGFAPLRGSLISGELLLTKVAEEQQLALQPKLDHALFATAIMLCKYMSEIVPFKLEKSERVKRKSHALDLLTHMLEKGRYFFHSRTGSNYLLRRFVCSSLLIAGVTDVSFVFQNVLKQFLTLCLHYQGTNNAHQHILANIRQIFSKELIAILEPPNGNF